MHADPVTTLREAGLRATRPRLAVLSWLHDTGGHRTVDDIRAGLVDTGIRLPRASVHNVVTDLTRVQLLLVADVGPGATRYEIADVAHHHLVCHTCGEVVDVPCRNEQGACLDLARPTDGAKIESAQVLYRGRCAACVAAER